MKMRHYRHLIGLALTLGLVAVFFAAWTYLIPLIQSNLGGFPKLRTAFFEFKLLITAAGAVTILSLSQIIWDWFSKRAD